MQLIKSFHLVLVLLYAGTVSCQNTPSTPSSVNSLTPFATGLSSVVCITNAGDSRLFVVEQTGYIRIVSSTGVVNQQPYLDIHDKVTYGGERGFLGVAFHPQYQTNGYFYVNYVGKGDSTHISRFRVSSGNRDIADPQSELKLMTIYQPYANHNGGTLCFGPDGYLYIGMGDGGSAGDPGNRAQNLKVILGKMLRININQGNPYSIPTTNPFYNNTNALGEIWALGLRNPWKFSFDRLTGDLWIADVGQGEVEEIDFQNAGSAGGQNYGWRCYEGNQAYNTDGCAPSSALTFPVYSYPHGTGECSVTGGYVYRGNSSSPYYGHYFFADYCSDRIWTLHNESGNWVKEDFGQFTVNNFSTFGEDMNGQLYIAGHSSGTIYRIISISNRNADILVSDKIKIMQIPYSGKIRIETDLPDQQLIRLSLCDEKGTTIYKASTRNAIYEFDPGLLTGTYIVNVIIQGKKYVKRLILQMHN